MSERLRSIVSHLREFVGNRRRAPRYRIRLEAELSLIVSAFGAKPGAASKHLRLAGHTRDISSSGLALIVPSIRIGEQYITGENRALQILVKLPTGPIEVQATPVRYSPLDEDADDTGYLIGVKITDITDADRARYTGYIEGLRGE